MVKLESELAVITAATAAAATAVAVSVAFPTPVLFCTMLCTFVHIPAVVSDVLEVVDRLLLWHVNGMSRAMLLLVLLPATVMHNTHAIIQATFECKR